MAHDDASSIKWSDFIKEIMEKIISSGLPGELIMLMKRCLDAFDKERRTYERYEQLNDLNKQMQFQVDKLHSVLILSEQIKNNYKI